MVQNFLSEHYAAFSAELSINFWGICICW